MSGQEPPRERDLLLALDDRAASDPALVGDKAALLARARALGLPVQRAHCVPIPAPGLRRLDDTEVPLPPTLAHALDRWGRSFKPLVVRHSAATGLPHDWSERAAVGARRAIGTRELTAAVRAALRDQLAAVSDRDPAGRSLLIADALTPALLGHARLCSPQGVAERIYLVEALDPAQPAAIQRLQARSDGSSEWPASGPALLTPAQLEAVVELAEAAQQVLETPVAIDWLLTEQRLWLTRLDPLRRDRCVLTRLGAQAAGLEIWSNFALRENLQQPMTPLTFSIWRDGFLPIVLQTLTGLPRRATRERRMLPVDRISGRFYWSVNRLRATPTGALLLGIARWVDPGAGAALARLLERQLIEPPPLTGLRRLWAFGHSLFGFLGAIRRALEGLAPHRTEQHYRAIAAEQLAAAHAPLTGQSDRQLVEALDAALVQSRSCLESGLAQELLSVWALYLCRVLWPRLARRRFDEVAPQLPPGPAAGVAIALRDIAAQLAQAGIAEIPAEAAFWDQPRLASGAGLAARAGWLGLLEGHGHGGSGELGVSSPRWCEDPTPLLRALRFLLGRGQLPAATGEQRSRGSVAALTHPESAARLPLVGRWLVAALQYTTAVAALRSVPSHAFGACLFRLRTLLREVGRRLVERHTLVAAGDLDLLELDEVKDLLLGLRRDQHAIGSAIEARRRGQQLDGESAPPDTVRSDGVADALALRPAPVARLAGFAASGGSAVGRCRLVRDPDRDPFAAGDVLIAAAVTPGWAPLLAAASAVVTDFGEYGCHAAALARELGIPAVVGVSGVLELLPSGVTIRVDGDRGVVEVLSE